MRQRIRNGPNNPITNIFEFAWDKTTFPNGPFIRDTRNRSSYDPGTGIYSTWAVPNGYPTTEEQFFDDMGSDGRFRTCYHIFRRNEFPNQPKCHRYWGGWGGNAFLSSVTAADITAARTVQSPPTIDWDEMASEAVSFMVPRLNEGTSLINSVLELKDLKRMNPFPSIERLKNRHTTFKRLRASKKERAEFVRELATRMNNAHLNAAFGIVPFLTDIITIQDEMIDLVMKLERLKRSVGKRLQRHYKRVIPVSNGVFADRHWKSNFRDTSWVHPVRSDFYGGGFRQQMRIERFQRWIKRPTYHATMRYSYDLPEMDNTHAEVLARLDVLGVRLDPSIIWNAIQFSFVVDWVVDVSGFLQKFARDNYPINTTIHDFCHSYSWHSESQIFVSYPDDPHPTISTHAERYGDIRSFDRAQVFDGSEISYDRRLATPDYSAIRYRALKYRQAALAGSLLLSRTRWGKAKQYNYDSKAPVQTGRGLKAR